MAPSTDLSKIEYAAIHVAAGVHGTVAPEQLAKTAVTIAAAVLAECECWTAEQAKVAADSKVEAKHAAAEAKHESHRHA